MSSQITADISLQEIFVLSGLAYASLRTAMGSYLTCMSNGRLSSRAALIQSTSVPVGVVKTDGLPGLGAKAPSAH